MTGLEAKVSEIFAVDAVIANALFSSKRCQRRQ